jgi:hypothetical protein
MTRFTNAERLAFARSIKTIAVERVVDGETVTRYAFYTDAMGVALAQGAYLTPQKAIFEGFKILIGGLPL